MTPEWWMALAALVLLALLVVVVVVLAVRQVRLGVQHERTRLLVDALDARMGGVQRRLEEVPGIGTGRHEVALVLNPIKTHADRVRRELERLAEAEGLGEVLVLETQEDDPGTAMARQALDAGARLVIAAGGDGTVRTVAEQLAGTDVALGVVPLGTGNLLARNLDLPINDVEQCLRIAVGGRQRRIDTVDVRFTHEDGRVTRQTFTVIGGAGYDADIMGDTKDELKSLAGWLAYSEAGMRHLRGKRHEVTVALDGGQPRRFKVRTVMVANCGMLTGGVELLPQAKLDDGLLDVMVLSPRHALDWARIAVKTVTRHPSSVPAMHTEQAQRVKVEFAEPMPSQLDGDATGVITALDARVRPDSLVVMLVAEDDASVRDDGVSAAAPVPEPAPHI
ncbi:diacylglycerol kinase family protein [Micrococcus luteus]|nr:diacylglycerol kinase family protein [Micrococcus luteus]